jgi:predicted regulator of Ras-like GTPase activity (Roadblock/LC7/MglB family)
MFKFIKSLFGDSPRPEPVSKSSNPAVEPAPAAVPAHAPTVAPAPAPARPAIAQARPTAAPPRAPAPVPHLQGAPYVELPLACITQRLSEHLRARMSRPPGHGDLVRVSLTSTLEQLPRGAVRIPFRELRLGAPSGLFTGSSDLDEVPVDLPLAEILSRLKPSYLARRPDQKRLSSPEALPSVFSSRTGRAAAPAVNSTPNLRDEAGSSRIIAESGGKSIPAPSALRVNPTAPGHAHQPASPSHSSASTLHPITGHPTSQRVSEISPRVPAPATHRPTPPATPVEPPSKPTHWLQTPQAEPLKVPLVSLARNWPESLRRDILGAHLSASVNFPFTELEAAMKRGQAMFTWKQLRLWLHPKPSTVLAEHDAVSLELPLAVIVPLFLARRSEPGSPKKKLNAETMPDVFQARKPAEAPQPLPQETESSAAAPASTDPRLRKEDAKPEAANSVAPDQLTLARSSGLPTQTVQRACHLTGVAGALLATTDGLVIAGQLPSKMNVDTAAGLLPQIFSRIAQYTRELKLGEPSQVEIMVENVPLCVIKTPNALFAVLGKNAEPLPKLQLSALAKQLSQRTT